MIIQDGSISEQTHKYQQNNDKLHKKVLAKPATGYQGIKETPQSPATNGAIDFNAFVALSRKHNVSSK
jgi:hypothetical protein